MTTYWKRCMNEVFIPLVCGVRAFAVGADLDQGRALAACDVSAARRRYGRAFVAIALISAMREVEYGTIFEFLEDEMHFGTSPKCTCQASLEEVAHV